MTSLSTIALTAIGTDDESPAASQPRVCSASAEDHGRREWLHVFLGCPYRRYRDKTTVWVGTADDGTPIRISRLRPIDVQFVNDCMEAARFLNPVRIPEEHFED